MVKPSSSLSLFSHLYTNSAYFSTELSFPSLYFSDVVQDLSLFFTLIPAFLSLSNISLPFLRYTHAKE